MLIHFVYASNKDFAFYSLIKDVCRTINTIRFSNFYGNFAFLDSDLCLLLTVRSSRISQFAPLLIALVGLPARGKSQLAHRLSRHLNWNGESTKGKILLNRLALLATSKEEIVLH